MPKKKHEPRFGRSPRGRQQQRKHNMTPPRDAQRGTHLRILALNLREKSCDLLYFPHASVPVKKQLAAVVCSHPLTVTLVLEPRFVCVCVCRNCLREKGEVETGGAVGRPIHR